MNRNFVLFFGILLINFLSDKSQAQSRCLEKPQLFLRKKGVSQQVGESEPFVVLSDVAKEGITCQSSRNVEWHYIGQGEPSKLQETAEVEIATAQEDGSLQYCMHSRISFYHKQSDTDLSKHTGRYVCQEIGNSSNQASVYIYTGSRNAPIFLHSRKVSTLPLSAENLTDSSFYIPCVTSTPSVNATLLRKSASSSKYELISDSENESSSSEASESFGSTPTFDPQLGFRVNTGSATSQNLSAYYGEYKCVSKRPRKKDLSSSSSQRPNANNAADDDFVIYNLVKPPTFKATPAEKDVFTSTVLNLTCESTEEPVILKEIRIRRNPVGLDDYAYEDEDNDDADSDSAEDDILETVEKTEQKLHVANYLEKNPVPGSFGEFQCIAEKDGRVLHSWRYRILDKKEEKLSGIKFNKRDKSFSCKTKTGMPGRVSFVSCRTPTECQINRICLEKSENCRGYSNATKALCHRGNHFCGKIFYKGGSGLIRCVGEGIDQIRGFTDEANDQKLRMGFHKLKPSETALLKISSPQPQSESNFTSSKKEFVEGEVISVNLKLGYYYFVYPMQWAIKFKNGSSAHIAPETEELQKSKLYRNVEAKLRLPITSMKSTSPEKEDQSSEIVGLNALIPLRSSVQPSWKTITLPIHVIGQVPRPNENEVDNGTSSNIPTGRTDIEFDEVTQPNNESSLDLDQNTDQSVFVTESIPVLPEVDPTAGDDLGGSGDDSGSGGGGIDVTTTRGPI